MPKDISLSEGHKTKWIMLNYMDKDRWVSNASAAENNTILWQSCHSFCVFLDYTSPIVAYLKITITHSLFTATKHNIVCIAERSKPGTSKM